MTTHFAKTLTPDLCIIGAGPAGLAAAMGAAALNVPTVVVDEADLGTALPRAGDVARCAMSAAARRGTPAGWDLVRFAAIGAAEAGAPDMSAERLAALGLTVVRGKARFTGMGQIEAAGCLITARRFLVATGATPSVPALPGLADVPWFTPDGIFGLPRLPQHLIVLGANTDGVELAQTFAKLGSAVTLVGHCPPPLHDVDPELAAPVLAQLARDGVAVRSDLRPDRVRRTGSGIDLLCQGGDGSEETIGGSDLLVAAERRPSINGLGLDAAKIRCAPTGIAVRPDGRSSNPRVYAIGDVVGLGRSVQMAEAQAAIALRSALFRQPLRFDPRTVPRLIRTDPEVATVGLSEAQARERAGGIRILRSSFGDNPRAQAEGRREGHLKVIAARSGRILGAGIVGPEAGEAVSLWALAIAKGLTASDIAAPPPAFACLCRPGTSRRTLIARGNGAQPLGPTHSADRAATGMNWIYSNSFRYCTKPERWPMRS